MKQSRYRIALAIMGAVAFFALLGWAGRLDYNEQVILHMSQDDYDTIVQRLSFHGHQPSDNEIVQYYTTHFK